MNSFEKMRPNTTIPNPNNKEAAKKRQEEIDKQKEAFFKKGGKITPSV